MSSCIHKEIIFVDEIGCCQKCGEYGKELVTSLQLKTKAYKNTARLHRKNVGILSGHLRRLISVTGYNDGGDLERITKFY